MRTQEAVVCRIRELIEEKEITVSKLSIISAVPPSTLKNIINGNSKNTGIVTIAKLCDGLGISLQEFIADPVFSGLDQEIE